MGNVAEYISFLKTRWEGRHDLVHHEVVPGRGPAFAGPPPLHPEIESMLGARGLLPLYSHQARALELIAKGRNVVVATPTASGKSLIYNLPVLDAVMKEEEARALYLFPLKALAQDQLRHIEELASGLPQGQAPTAAIYDGDTTPYRRRKIREQPPHILITNPDMLHLSLLPYHAGWAGFFKELRFVVVDEVHTYRGLMGSHMAWIIRRLRRIAALYGAEPRFIFSSATIGNPEELCSLLSGTDVAEVTESGAPTGTRHLLFVNPSAGASSAVVSLLKQAVRRGLKTIVYCQSRRLAELLSIWIKPHLGKEGRKVASYRSGFLPEERRRIEAAMTSGELHAVVATSALELGIDIGALDLCILLGYPGTVMSTWQRAGRVGRARQDSAAILVAQQDALDQYFMRNPKALIHRPPEDAVVNPGNPSVTESHLECAAAELPLETGEGILRDQGAAAAARRLVAKGRLLESGDGEILFAARKSPHRDVDIRGTGSTFSIHCQKKNRCIGEIDGFRARRETHPGAIYLHMGRTYRVEELDIEARKVAAVPVSVDYFTRPRAEKTTEILETVEVLEQGSLRAGFGRLRITDRVTGYERRSVRGQMLINVVPLDLPPLVFETEGMWMEIPARLHRRVVEKEMHFMGGIHAVEHACIGVLPLLVLTDRNDFGGISIPLHPQVGQAAVFIYDAVPGGAGLSRQGFRRLDSLLSETLEMVSSCPCETGCPSCVHSPKCGSGNRPIDKEAARFILSALVQEGRASTAPPARRASRQAGRLEGAKPSPATVRPPREPGPFVVFDLETQFSAQEVGGWANARDMRISCAVAYDSREDRFLTFTEEQVKELIGLLLSAPLVVGFNVKRFDYAVLSRYSDADLHALPTLDILEHVHRRLGYRLSLDHLAGVTLNAKKGGNGLLALKWWREGKLDKIVKYCRKDVEITRDLYLHGLRKGHLLFKNKAGETVKLPVEW